MIFKQVDEILYNTKTQTRRIVKPNERLIGIEGVKTLQYQNLRWFTRLQVGKHYAVQPKRGEPGVWVNRDMYGQIVKSTDVDTEIKGGTTFIANYRNAFGKDYKKEMRHEGWQELRVRITDIRCESLQDISEQDALAEGVTGGEVIGFSGQSTISLNAYGAYHKLWNTINTRAPHRWQDNPDVWVISFKRELV